MAICVPTYTLGGVLTTYFGLSVGEALWAVFIANVIVLIPLTLNAFGGTKFGIPVPGDAALVVRHHRLERAGADPRAGGLRLVRHPDLVRRHRRAPDAGGDVRAAGRSSAASAKCIGFFIFWVANVWVVLRGSESIKWLEVVAAPLLLLVGVGLLVWAWPQASVSRTAGAPRQPPGGRVVPRATSSRASPRWSASGRRCRSTSRTSAASPNRRRARSSARSSGCR